MGLDPNTVAEYLDNTLAGERVPEFETVCLPPRARPMNRWNRTFFWRKLPPVIRFLTMVLGHPALVDPEMKHRMYRSSTKPKLEKAVSDPEAEDLRLAPIEDGLSTGIAR